MKVTLNTVVLCIVIITIYGCSHRFRYDKEIKIKSENGFRIRFTDSFRYDTISVRINGQLILTDQAVVNTNFWTVLLLEEDSGVLKINLAGQPDRIEKFSETQEISLEVISRITREKFSVQLRRGKFITVDQYQTSSSYNKHSIVNNWRLFWFRLFGKHEKGNVYDPNSKINIVISQFAHAPVID